jgi:hypothetical protein
MLQAQQQQMLSKMRRLQQKVIDDSEIDEVEAFLKS